MKEDKETKTLTQLLEKLLNLIGVTANVHSEKDKEGINHLAISTENPALLIGYHGRTINALQTILGVICYKNFGENFRVVVDVDGWREKREEKLIALAKNIAQRVREGEREEPMYNLTNSERRVVHLALVDEPDVTTESVGEGRDRYLIIKVKNQKSKVKSGQESSE